MSTNADKILADALAVKEIMDDIIRDGARDVEAELGPFSVKDYSIGDGKYMDEDGCLIRREEAQDNADNSNRLWAKYGR